MSNQLQQELESTTPVHGRHNGSAVGETADLAQANTRLRQQIEQMRRYNEAMLQLTAPHTTAALLDERLEQITVAIARAMDVQRVGVWLYDKAQTKIECIKRYEYGEDRFSSGLELLAADFPRYFQALRDEFTIDADDVLTDPRTSEFADSYLKPLGITSRLDLPIQRGETVLGVICLEHVGPRRQWTSEEKNFAATAANQISLALESQQRRQAEVNLQENERMITLLMSNLPGMVYRCRNDQDWTMAFVSSGATTLTGYQPDDLIDNRTLAYADLIHLDDQDAVWESVQAGLAEKRPFTISYRLQTANGEEKWVWEQGSGIFDDDGQLLGLEGFITDITERERVNQALTDSEIRFRTLAENVPSVIYLCNNNERYTMAFINDQVEALTGYSARAFLDDEVSFVELYHPDDVPANEKEVITALDAKEPFYLQYRLKHKQGAWRWVEEIGSGIYNDAGELLYLEGVLNDVTDRIERERALETRLRYEHGLSLASRVLLAPDDTAVAQTLEYLREAADACRAYYFEIDEHPDLGLYGRQLYETCAPGIAPQIDDPDLQQFAFEKMGFSRWLTVLPLGDYINSLVADIPESEQRLLAFQETKSILVLPVIVDGEWYGFIGFDDTKNATAWHNEDVRLLQTAAGMIGAYLERSRLNQEIHSSLHLREAQVRVSTLVAREIAAMPDLGQLYERIIALIKEEFGYYHVQLLRYDPAMDNVGLVVGYGEIGQKMLAMNHSMPMGVGVIGKAAAEGRSVLLSNVGDDPNWRPNNLLPETRSELAVPIKAGDEVLGVIDVQSNRVDGLTSADQLLLDGLSGQLAIAIESTRLRQDMEDRLRELNSLQRFMSRSAWSNYQAEQRHTAGYLFHRGDVQPLDARTSHLLPTQSNTATATDSVPAVTNPETTPNHIQPLAVRGETIGKLVVEADEERPLTAEEEIFLQSVSEQVAEALEAARLFEQTQVALAEQERLSSELATVAQVSTAASTILEAEALLQAAVDLAQASFDLTHAHIYLYNKETQMLVLQAGGGDAGRLMTLEGRAIALNADSLVARVARERQGSIINDVQKALEFIPHPLLTTSRSELAMPMIVGGSLIGVLDLLSGQVDRFSEQDMNTFSTLASQVAVAVQNAQLYAEQVATAEELRKIDQLKSEFLASMSHELRTPLNSIIGFADVLLEGIDGELNERMEQDVRLIRDSGSHLRVLIGDILDMSKIEAGMMEIRREALDFGQLVEDVLMIANPLAQEKNLSLNLELADNIPTIYADDTRLRQILWNIVGNAIKFSHQGGVTVAAEFSRKNDELLVRVSDTGVGIRKSDLSVVFEQFRQVGGELNTSSSGGTGLGLPISKKLVELHGGTIWVESKVGEGTSCFFTLPVGLPSVKEETKPKTGPLSFLS